MQTKEQTEQRDNNIVISGIIEEEGENARSLKAKVQDLFNEHFDMSDVPMKNHIE